jgi:phenylpyruvate tautomerase
MPYLSMQTNKEVDPSELSNFLGRASKSVAELLNKPESYVMISAPVTAAMMFAGSNEPCAMLNLKSLGFPEQRSAEISSSLCELVADCFAIDPSRIYIEFSSPARHLWGWNKSTF